MQYYDLIIVGSGPSGLALAHVCSNIYRRVLVIDKEYSIGGIHRVKRDYYGIYTEYGPRIYMNVYYNFINIIREIGLNYESLFKKYKYNFISNLLFRNQLSIYEKYILMRAYMRYFFNDNYGKSTSLYEYIQFYKFTTKSIAIIDTLCAYIDEGNVYSYSLNKFIKMYDILFYSKVMVPSKALDCYLFKTWKRFLENRGVEIILEKEIANINIIDDTISCIELVSGENIGCVNLVLAVPPIALLDIIKDNDMLKDSFGDFNELKIWAENTKYRNYISITYHFKNYIEFFDSNGLTLHTDWGIIVVNLSEYCDKIENSEYPVLSVMVTLCDKKSSYNNKTANECSGDDLILEVYRQLKICYVNINIGESYDYFAVINPNNYYDNDKKIWRCSDNAYYNMLGEKYIAFKSRTIDNLYTLGTHNGRSYIQFNCIESAISNAISLGCELYPDVRKKYFVKRGIYLKDFIFALIIMSYIFIFYYSIYK